MFHTLCDGRNVRKMFTGAGFTDTLLIWTTLSMVLSGAVHTWCSGTSAWVLAQNGVVFTTWLPNMWLCFALSDAILKHELSGENKAVWTARKLQKLTCAHRDPVSTFAPEYRVETLCSGTRTVLDKRVCLHLVPSEYRTQYYFNMNNAF